MYTEEIHKHEKTLFRGDALLYAGYTFEMVFGDYPAMQLYFRRVK